MFIFLAILISIISVLIIGITIVQNSKKEEGNSFDGMGAHILMGVKQTNDFLINTTWILFSLLIILAFGIHKTLKQKTKIVSPNLELIKKQNIEQKADTVQENPPTEGEVMQPQNEGINTEDNNSSEAGTNN